MTTATALKDEHIIAAISEQSKAGKLGELCDDCPVASWAPETAADFYSPGFPGEFDCPADGDHSCAACVRRPEVMEFEDILARAAHLQAEADGEKEGEVAA